MLDRTQESKPVLDVGDNQGRLLLLSDPVGLLVLGRALATGHQNPIR